MPFPRIKGRNPLPMVANNNAVTQAVLSLNNLINHIDITGGKNIQITTQGQYIGVHSDANTIAEVLDHLNNNYPGWADTGVNTLNTLDGDLEIVGLGTISVSTSGNNSILVSGQNEFDCSQLVDCNVVFTTGDQIISGEKRFADTLVAESGILVGTGSNQASDGVKIDFDQITILGNPVLTGIGEASGINISSSSFGMGASLYAGNQSTDLLAFKTITGTGGLEIIEDNNLLIFSGGAGGASSSFSCDDLADCNVVYTTGDQLISGKKTMADDFTVGEGDYVLQVENDTITVSGIVDITGQLFLNGCEANFCTGAGGVGGSGVSVLDEGNLLGHTNKINFIGDDVTAVKNGDQIDVTIVGGGAGTATGVTTGEGIPVYSGNLDDNTLIFSNITGDPQTISVTNNGNSILISGIVKPGGAGGAGGGTGASGVNTGEGVSVYSGNLDASTLIFKKLSGDGTAITISETGDSVFISGRLFQTGITQIIRPYGYWQKTGDDLYYESGNVAVGGLPESGTDISPDTAFSVSYKGVLLQRDTDLRIKDTGQLFVETCGDVDADGTPKPAILIGPEMTGYTGAGGVYYEGVYQKESGLAIYCDGITLDGDDALFNNDELAKILANRLTGLNEICFDSGKFPGKLAVKICDEFYAGLSGLLASGKSGLLGGGVGGVSSLETLSGHLTLSNSRYNGGGLTDPANWSVDPYINILNTGQGVNGNLQRGDIKLSFIGNLAFYRGGSFTTSWTPSTQASLYLDQFTGVQLMPHRTGQVRHKGNRLAINFGDVKGGQNYGGGSGIFINKDCDQPGYNPISSELSNLRFKTLTAGDNVQFSPEGGDHNNIRIDTLTGGPVQIFYDGTKLTNDQGILNLKFQGPEASAAITANREVTISLTGRNGGKHYYKDEGVGVKFADTINFRGAGVSCTSGPGDSVNVNVPVPTARFSAWNYSNTSDNNGSYLIANIGTGYTGIGLEGRYAENKRAVGWGADLYTDPSNSDKLVLDIDQPKLALFNGYTWNDQKGANHTYIQSDNVSGRSKSALGEGIDWGHGPETANPIGYYTGLNFVGRGVKVWDTNSYYCRTPGSCSNPTIQQRRANTVTIEITGNVWGATNMGEGSGFFGTEGAYQQGANSNDDGLLYFRSLKPGAGVTMTLHNEGSVEEYYEIQVPTGNTIDVYEDGVLKQSEVDGLNFTTGLNVISDTIGLSDVTKIGIDKNYIAAVTAAGSGVNLYNEGALVGRFSDLDFIGAGVTVTSNGTIGRIDITSGGGGASGVTMLNGLTGNIDIAFSGYNGASPYGGTFDFIPDITTDNTSNPQKINIQAVPTGDFLTEAIFNHLFDFYPNNNPSGFVRMANFQGAGGINVSYAPVQNSIYGDVTYTVTVSGDAPSDGKIYGLKNGSWTEVTGDGVGNGGLAQMPPRVVYETGTSHIESLKIFEVEDNGGDSIRPVVTGVVGRKGETSAPLMYSGENFHTITGHSAADASINIDWGVAETHVKKITQNTAISFSNHLVGEPHNGRTIQVILKNDGTLGGGTYSYNVSWPADVKWAGGVAPGFGHIGDGRYAIYNFTAITADSDFGISDVTGIFGAVVEDVY